MFVYLQILDAKKASSKSLAPPYVLDGKTPCYLQIEGINTVVRDEVLSLTLRSIGIKAQVRIKEIPENTSANSLCNVIFTAIEVFRDLLREPEGNVARFQDLVNQLCQNGHPRYGNTLPKEVWYKFWIPDRIDDRTSTHVDSVSILFDWRNRPRYFKTPEALERSLCAPATA